MILSKIIKNKKQAVHVPFKEAATSGLPYKRHSSNPRIAIVYCDWVIAESVFKERDEG